jgi:chromate transporter
VLVGALPFWESLRHREGIQTTMAGINAGVVGILLSALYDPVWTSAIMAGRISGWRSPPSGCWSMGMSLQSSLCCWPDWRGWGMAM